MVRPDVGAAGAVLYAEDLVLSQFGAAFPADRFLRGSFHLRAAFRTKLCPGLEFGSAPLADRLLRHKLQFRSAVAAEHIIVLIGLEPALRASFHGLVFLLVE